MTVTINASTNGLAQTSDLSGSLQLQTANTSAIIIGTDQTVNCSSTGATILPIGTTAQRPSSPVNGMIRYNTTLAVVELYNSGGWTVIS